MSENKRKITAALVGDPNTGKSTFFNAWTGMHQVTGNWPGVTVEKLLGQLVLPGGEELTLVDLPGIYSLHAVSEDEKVASDYARSAEPDIIINVIDAVNLERNLYLTLALAELGKPMVAVLTMTDILQRQGFTVDLAELSKRLGMPVVTSDVHKRAKRLALERAILEALATKQNLPRTVYPESLNQALIKAHREGEPEVLAIHRLEGILPGAEAVIADVEKVLGTTPDVLIADARYDKIAEITSGIVKQVGHARTELGRTLDRFALNRWLGIPIFLCVMYLLFWFTQVVGGRFIDFFDGLGDAIFVTGLGNVLTLCGAPEWLNTLLASGLGTGVQTVMTFIPPVFFIFFGLSLLEDSGYMARAAYVMDRFMRLLGLPGSAFVPMLVGFGCTVPAIMATRTLSNRRDRLLTIFMTPFMSCGARLPVYALFGAAFFGAASGTMVFAIYLCGIVLALLTGLLLKHTLFVGDPAPFVMELPLYHIPRLSTVLKQAWERLQRFIFRAGKVLVVMVLLLSVCDKIQVPDLFSKGAEPVAAEAQKEEAVATPAPEQPTISVIEMLGRTIAPVFAPMGVERENWQGSVALIVGLFAKEQVVSSLNTLYAIDGSAEEEEAEEEPLSWERAREDFVSGVVDAVKTIPDAFSGLLDSFFDPLGVNIFKSEYEQVLRLADRLTDPSLTAERMQKLQAQMDDALAIKDLHDELQDATNARNALAQQAAVNEALKPQLEVAEEELSAVTERLGQASALQAIAKEITSGKVPAEERASKVAEIRKLVDDYYAESIAAETETDASLMSTLNAKFDGDRNRAFAYLLFVLLYVPCLAAMATVVREIGWGYSSILFGYLTLLGWCVATLYFQVTTGHNPVWLITPCAILAAIAIFFCALGRRLKVKLVI